MNGVRTRLRACRTVDDVIGILPAAPLQPRRLMIAPAADGCNRLLGRRDREAICGVHLIIASPSQLTFRLG